MTSQQSLNHTSYFSFEFDELELYKSWTKEKLIIRCKEKGFTRLSNKTKNELIYQLVKNYMNGWNTKTKQWEH